MKKTNKLLISAAVAALMATPMAASAASSGIYFGGQAGWADTNIKTDNGAGSELDGLSATGVSGALIVGTQKTISTGIMAFEANLGDSSAEYEAKDGTSQSTITSDLTYGASVKLGTDMSRRTQVYGLLGYQFTDMEFNSRTSAVGGVTTLNSSETYSGPRFGFGMQTQITRDLTLRMEWSRTLYDDQEIEDSDLTLEPTESQFSVGVVGFF